MELKELTQNILEILKVDSHAKLTQRIMHILESPERNTVFESYLVLCPDLLVDWLQKV